MQPVAPALLLKGAIDTDPDMIALNCSYQDFVTDKFHETGIFDMISKKVMTTDNIQAEDPGAFIGQECADSR